MKLSIISTLVALSPGLIAASPIQGASDLEARQAGDCRVNREVVETWHQAAQTRRRIRVTADGTPPDNYCDIWHDNGTGNPRNKQCYIHETWGHVIDVSFDLGAFGDKQFFDLYESTLEDWRTKYHCATG